MSYLHKNVASESGVGEHFDAAFIDIFARKSNTRVNVEKKPLNYSWNILNFAENAKN